MKRLGPKLINAASAVAFSAAIGTTAAANGRAMVYIANADSRDIYVLELDEANGSTKLIEKVPVSGEVMMLAASPDRKRLYACLCSKPYSVSAFNIEPGSGRLTFRQTVPLADNMAYLRTDRTGRYLIGASYMGNKISVNAIDTDGEVNPNPLSVIPTGKNAHAAATDPSNKFLLVTNLGDDVILQFRFDADTGEITPNQPPAVESKKGAGPRHLVFHPKGRLLFCSNELDGTVDSYRYDSFGKLTKVDSITVMPVGFKGGPPTTADLHLTPDAKFLYVSERTSHTIAGFRVNGDTGELTLIGNFPTELGPRGFNIDPKGKYLLAVGQRSNGMSIYSIDPVTGILGLLSHQEVGKNPNWVEIVLLPTNSLSRAPGER